MANKFKVGDLVTINDKSKHKSQGYLGDEKMVGTISEDSRYSSLLYFYRVIWPDGNKDVYRDEDLDLHQPIINYEIY